MPRNQGTSRKGKPGKRDRAIGFGKALQRAHNNTSNNRPPLNSSSKRQGAGGMAMQPGVESIGFDGDEGGGNKTKSVLEVQDVDDFLQQARMAGREFASEREGLVVLDTTGYAYRGPPSVKWSSLPPTIDDGGDDAQDGGAVVTGGGDGVDASPFAFKELSVPRRPAWDSTTTPSELDRNERRSFLEWRRGIAAKEEELYKSAAGRSRRSGAPSSSSVTVTPFEKNLEVWRQLWRVLERSSCLLQLVDARNPLFYLSEDLREYAKSLGGEGGGSAAAHGNDNNGKPKPMMVLVNKSDFLTKKQRRQWYEYLKSKGWDSVVFFSAVNEQRKLDLAAQQERRRQQEEFAADPTEVFAEEEEEDTDGRPEEKEETPQGQHAAAVEEAGRPSTPESDSGRDVDGVDVPLTRQQLMDRMLSFAREHGCQPDPKHDNRVQFGMVGFPNVGKSSVINVLVGSSKHAHGVVRVGVASQPGKTKHFQTLLMPDNDDMMLCDCPGLVFPSFVSNTADLIAAGVYPIAQMRDHWPVVELICQRIPREVLNAQYGIQLPPPPPTGARSRNNRAALPPTAEEFLTTYCISRSMLAASSGVPDFPRAARVIIRDYAEGKLLYCHPPPNIASGADEDRSSLDEFYGETIATALHNTKKLREKLNISDITQSEKNKVGEDAVNDFDSVDPAVELGDDPLDDDLLELVAGSSLTSQQQANSTSSNNAVQQSGKKHHKKQKHRKNRNKDPHASTGVHVNARKHSAAGYTRPTSYGI